MSIEHPSRRTGGRKGTQMELEHRKHFLINLVYIAALLFLTFATIRYALPMVAPFAAAFFISAALQRPIRFAARHTGLSKGICAILTALLFYSTIGLLVALLCVKLFTFGQQLVLQLPALYANQIEPVLFSLSSWLEQTFTRMDPTAAQTVNDLLSQAINSLGSSVSALSVGAIGTISGYASSLPGFFVKLLLMIISTFFIAKDYDLLVGFVMRQFSTRGQALLVHIREYLVGTLLICIRSYALIMSITFIELAVGLTLIGVEHSVLIALCISIFDILPVLGTGGIMIPWTLISALQGNFRLTLGLAIVYLAITVIRNILEPKIVGGQLGLHPVVTLTGMFVGAQLFGILGLFGVPIVLSLLKNLNESGDIRLFR